MIQPFGLNVHAQKTPCVFQLGPTRQGTSIVLGEITSCFYHHTTPGQISRGFLTGNPLCLMEKPSKEAEQPPWTDQAPPRAVQVKSFHHLRPSRKPLSSDNTCRDIEACGKTQAPHVSYRCICTLFYQVQSGFNSYRNLIKSAEEEVLLMRNPQPKSSIQDLTQGQYQGELFSLPLPSHPQLA